MAYTAMASPDVYRQAIRSNVALWYTIDATRAGVTVAGATGMRPTGGSITDSAKDGARRVLNLELAPAPGLFNLLAPIGTTLTATAHIRLTGRQTVDIPMGVYDVDSQNMDEGGGAISLTAPDKWIRIQRARFIAPAASTKGMRATDQIAALIRGALGATEPVTVTATSKANMPALTWEKDRDKAINDIEDKIGAWVYFDRLGVATVADQPTAGIAPDWLVDASATGVMTSLKRERSRTQTGNVVVVESTASAGPAFPTQRVWDNDPYSPTYAGTNPVTNPGSAGPFGIVPYFHDNPVLTTVAEARAVGKALLARVSGLASQVSLGQVPNPAVDALDVLDVLPPRERYDIPRTVERHMADTVTHPLAVGSAQTIDGRSTRNADFDTGT